MHIAPTVIQVFWRLPSPHGGKLTPISLLRSMLPLDTTRNETNLLHPRVTVVSPLYLLIERALIDRHVDTSAGGVFFTVRVVPVTVTYPNPHHAKKGSGANQADTAVTPNTVA
jgi:hypothetical protein